MNPFEQKGCNIDQSFKSWKEIYPKSYSKEFTDPYTKTRIILMNGTEYEANWFSHQFARHCDNMDIRREIALTRRVEKQQQMTISCLKPINESLLEHTIGYEQLAVDLTAILAKREKDPHVKKALDFALLEDFDHLYRYADLLEMDKGIKAEQLVGKYTEIMPGRPTISEHRYPYDTEQSLIAALKWGELCITSDRRILCRGELTLEEADPALNIAVCDHGYVVQTKCGDVWFSTNGRGWQMIGDHSSAIAAVGDLVAWADTDGMVSVYCYRNNSLGCDAVLRFPGRYISEMDVSSNLIALKFLDGSFDVVNRKNGKTVLDDLLVAPDLPEL